MVQPQRVDNSAGNGSRSEIEDKKIEDKFESKDERSETETTFFKRDISQIKSERRRRQYKRMLRRQEGERTNSSDEKSRGQQNHDEWQRRIVKGFTSQLELTPHQTRRTKHLVMDVIDINSFGHYSTEQVVLAVINCVVREDGRWIEDEELFRDMAEGTGFNKGTAIERMKSLRGLVRDRLP